MTCFSTVLWLIPKSEAICACLDTLRPRPRGAAHRDLVSFVADRPGHDLRYAVDAAKIARELGWSPRHAFDEGVAATVPIVSLSMRPVMPDAM